MFVVREEPDLFHSQHKANSFALYIQQHGYRARVWNKASRNASERGYAVAVYSNNGFEGFAHAV